MRGGTGWWPKLLWFVGLWAVGVGTVALVGFAIKMVLAP